MIVAFDGNGATYGGWARDDIVRFLVLTGTDMPISSVHVIRSTSHQGGVSASFAAAALTLATPAVFHPALAETPCDTAGDLFIETTAVLGGTDGSVTFELVGLAGPHQFTFFSGVWQGDIIETINALVGSTGVAAEQSAENSERVRVHSVLAGNDAFVSATQIGGNAPLLFAVTVMARPDGASSRTARMEAWVTRTAMRSWTLST